MKVPAWLNDPIYYHNRGNSDLARREHDATAISSGLDDLMTENPRVVAGLIEIFGSWIDHFGIDGFRIDTARHVNPEFWQAFVPAMLERAPRRTAFPISTSSAKSPTTTMDPGSWPVHTRVDRFPRCSTSPSAPRRCRRVAGKPGRPDARRGCSTAMRSTRAARRGARSCRPSSAITTRAASPCSSARPSRRRATPRCSQRVKLAHAMMLTLRGVPTIYSGDEQGFVGDGDDQDAREDMFAIAGRDLQRQRAARHARDDRAIEFRHATIRSIAQIARLAKLRSAHAGAAPRPADHPRRRRKSRACSPSRASIPRPGAKCCCVQHLDEPVDRNVRSRSRSPPLPVARRRTAPPRATAPGSVACRLPAFGYAVCAARPNETEPACPQTDADDAAMVARRGRSTRSIRAASPTRTATGSATCRASPARLDHVASLGVDAIWLSPFFTSPMKDFGYDVADYCDVDPIFGTLADFDALIARAHALGLKVIIDQVYSHTSDQHAWFAESRAEPRPTRKADWYVWADAKPDGIAADQLAVGVRRPGLDLGRAARPILSAQFPAASSRSSTCTIPTVQDALLGRRALLAGPRRRRLPHRCDQLRDARSRRCATIRPRPMPASRARARSISSSSCYNQSPSRHRRLPRAHPRADRQLRRPLHRGRGRRRQRRRRDAGLHRGREPAEQRLWLRLSLRRAADAGAGRAAPVDQWPDGAGGRLAELGLREPRRAARAVALGAGPSIAPPSRD